MKSFRPSHARWRTCVALWLCVLYPGPLTAQDNYETVTFKTSDGGSIEADLFKGTTDRAVVLAHGGVFNKESWHDQARRLQAEGITALSINFRGYGKSKASNERDKHLDVLGAIEYLKKHGYERIGILGGSMGAMAVDRALQQTDDPKIDKVILLAPPSGQALTSPKMKKLFITSEGDFAARGTRAIHEGSSEPKQLKVYPGDSHAQHLFKTEHAEDLNNLIVRFMKD